MVARCYHLIIENLVCLSPNRVPSDHDQIRPALTISSKRSCGSELPGHCQSVWNGRRAVKRRVRLANWRDIAKQGKDAVQQTPKVYRVWIMII